MVTLTMTDCSVADNRVQALHELDRCATGVAHTTWCLKWGRPLIEAAGGAITEDDHAEAVAEAHREADDANCRANELRDAIETAIKELDKIEGGDITETREAIDAVIADLNNAL